MTTKKFRFWYEKDRFMTDPVELRDILRARFEHFGEEIRSAYTVALQYTGVNDRSGTELYEGYVVVYRDPFSESGPETFVVEICSKIEELNSDYLKTIGNIYQNPGLKYKLSNNK